MNVAESRPERPATIADVAKLAGVSTATVSYVLNGRHLGRIPDETRTKVRSAARKLGYVAQSSARSLSRGRTDLVLVHLGDGGMLRDRPVAIELARLGADLRRAGYGCMLDGDPSLRGVPAARAWAALRPAAVVADAACFTGASVELLHGSGVVAVGMGRAASPFVPTVLLDDSSLGRAAAEHLVERGCGDLVALMPRVPGLRPPAEARFRGAQEVAAARGARIRPVTMGLYPADAAGIARAWAGGDGRPDGVFGFDDRHAGMLLGALTDAGLRVPGDLALVGAEDEPLCELLRPRLTSVGVARLPAGIAGPVLAAVEHRWDPNHATLSWPAHLRRRDT
ncbi:LacI family DNA-binding transcriptional regulator [Nonomuraea sp. M3C6]|uniref:LacI family DNA-binding transcriptional regulator n=1 Tax=Nonomuraea marmarensis TaxID=3351344 RepID=A0ABW7ADL4_9ACTN